MYFRPAEWRAPKTIWLGWPFDHELWGDDLEPAQQEFTELVKALSRERVMVVIPTEKERAAVVKKLGFVPHCSFAVLPFGDIWLRDTFPIFVRDESQQVAAILPRFNGWGKKYQFADDMDLSERVVKHLGVPFKRTLHVFEGGAIECDGRGTLLTTEQCLLNENRNPGITKADIEEEFSQCFGVKKVIWIKEGLKNDHTDGHIDTIARFVAPRCVAIMVPRTKTDPNYDVLMAIRSVLEHETDADGKKLNLLEVPSPQAVVNRDGGLMPASYLNFIVGDETLVVPLYGSSYDDEALRVFESFVSLNVVGVRAKAILSGGGAFHCMSQEFFR